MRRLACLLPLLLAGGCGGGEPERAAPGEAAAEPGVTELDLGGPLRDGLRRRWAQGRTEALEAELAGGEGVRLRLALVPLGAGAAEVAAQVQVGEAPPRRLTAAASGGFVSIDLPQGRQQVRLVPEAGVGLAAAEVLRSTPEPRRVVVVVVDTLRADHLGLYGYSRPTSPRLDALGAAGRWWTWALAPAPWTLPSTRALLSGRPHADFEAGPVLLERFAEAGWATAAILRNPWLSESNGFGAGAELFDALGEPRAAESTELALAWLRGATSDRDGVLVLHHMDPHLPYEAPGPVPEDLAASELGLPALAPEQRAQVAAYDAEIRYTDASLGALWDGLRQLPGESLLVVTSDHGEELWDHGGFEHGQSLHAELIRVPLVLAGDRVSEPGTRGVRGEQAAPASLLDVAPTVLAWAGLPHAELPGRDLLADEPGPFPPLLLGETTRGGEAWGLAAVDEAGRLGRYWVQRATEHLYEGADHLDGRNLAPDAAPPWRERLREAFGVEIVPGLALHVSRSALERYGPLDTLLLRSPSALVGARVARADAYDDRGSSSAELLDAHSARLHFGDDGTGGLVLRTAEAPPDRVVIEAAGERLSQAPRSDRRVVLPLPGGRLPVRLEAGLVAWPTEATPRVTAEASGEGAHAELEALGYVDP